MPESDTKRATRSRRRVEPAPEPEPEGHAPASQPVCTVAFCPICVAVTAVQPVRPDVVEHLLAAGRELLLAATAVLDARAEAAGRDGSSPGGLEKIDIG